jgi:hypothetical protein
VLLEADHQALRYVTGTGVAVNSRGKTVSINLDPIHDTARKLGPNITRAEYGIVCLIAADQPLEPPVAFPAE